MPEGRPIQQKTIGEILDIIAEASESTQSCGGICIAVVQPPGTGTAVFSLLFIDMPLYLTIFIRQNLVLQNLAALLQMRCAGFNSTRSIVGGSGARRY